MRKTLLSMLLATAFVMPPLATTAVAQRAQGMERSDSERGNGNRGGGWQRGAENRAQNQAERQVERRAERQVERQIDRPREVRQEQPVIRQRMNEARVDTPRVPAPRVDVRPDRTNNDGNFGNRNWRGNRDRDVGNSAPVVVQQQAQRDRDNRPVVARDPRFDRNQDGRVDRDWDRNRDGTVDNRFDRNRDGNLDRNYDRNRDGNLDRRFDRNEDGRADRRFGQNNQYGGQNWNREWRGDRRYNWYDHRNQYRSHYRQPRYYNPYGYGYGYQRFSIGIYLNSLFFSSRYWINDPYDYRLPRAPYGYRWVRYYNDVVLVDQRNGYVVDVIHNFFW